MEELDDSGMTPVYKITFPDDEFEDITTQNIIPGTPELEQSLWEGSSMQLGGCVSALYRCTLFETEEDVEAGITKWNWNPLMNKRHIQVIAGYEETEVICIYDGYIKEANRQKNRSQIVISCHSTFSKNFDIDVSDVYNNSFALTERYKGVWKKGTEYKRGDVVKDENDEQYYLIWNNYENLPASKKAVESAVKSIMKENSPSALVSEGGITYGEQTGTRIVIEYQYGEQKCGYWIEVGDLVRCMGTDISEVYKGTTCGALLRSVAAHVGFTGKLIIPSEMETHEVFKNMEATELSAKGCVAQIAEAFGCCARINKSGDIEFKKITIDTVTPTDIKDYENLTYGDYALTPIDGVCAKSQQGDGGEMYYPNTIEQCKNIYTIVDNFLFYDRAGTIRGSGEIAEKVFNGLNGFTYRGFEMKTFGMPWLEVGDSIRFVTPEGIEIVTIIQSRTLSGTTGAFRDTLKAECEAAECNDNCTSSYSSSSQVQGSVNYYLNEAIKYVKDMEIEGGRITDSTITGSKIADSTLQGSHFTDGTITGSKIAGATLEGSHFIDGTITGSKIANSTLQGSHFIDGTITGAKIDFSTFSDGVIKGSVIESSTLKNIPFASIDNAFISELAADKGLFEALKVAGMMTADEADIRYANIWLSNVQTEYVAELFAKVGLIDRATIVEGHVTGYLDAVEVNADRITAGTLTTDRLIIRGSTESIVYELNNISGALQAQSVSTLNGEIITDRTITADKIVAKSITANEIDVANLFAQNITATGTITGLTLKGAKAIITEGQIGDFYIGDHSIWSGTGEGVTQSTLYIGHEGINISKLLQIASGGSQLYCSNGLTVRDKFGNGNFAYIQEDLIGLYSPDGNCATISRSGMTIGGTSVQENGFVIYEPNYGSARFAYYSDGFELSTNSGIPLIINTDALTVSATTMEVSGKLYVGSNKKVSIWEDNEGGNIKINAPSSYGNYWQEDAYNGNLRFYTYDSSGTYQGCSIDRNTGRINKADKAWGVADYNNASSTIKIGYAGNSLTTTSYFAAYGSSTTIKNISVASAQKVLGIDTIENIIAPLETWAYLYCHSTTYKSYGVSSFFALNVAEGTFYTTGASGAYSKGDNANIYLARSGTYLCLASVCISATNNVANVKRLRGVFQGIQCANTGGARLQSWESINIAFMLPISSAGNLTLQFQDESGGGTVYDSTIQIFKIC